MTLDAQIVRIMKGKKVLKLPDLINAVVDAVKNMFQPEVKAIKTQVESLIEREVCWNVVSGFLGKVWLIPLVRD